MADGTSGADEIQRLIIEARALNFDTTTREVQALHAALNKLEQQIRSGKGFNAGQINEFKGALERVKTAAESTGKGTKESLDSINKAASSLNDTLKKTAGMTGVANPKDKAEIREYTKSMSNLGIALKAYPPTLELVGKNIRTISEAMRTGTNAGIATAASIEAVRSGRPVAMEHINSMEQFRIKTQVARKGLEGITIAMKNSAKNAQWTGRQMIEGITVPIAGIGIASLSTFKSVNREMIQLKKVTEYREDYKALGKEIQNVAMNYGLSLKGTAALFKDVAALGKSGDDIKKWADSIAQLSLIGDIRTEDAMAFFRSTNAIFAGGNLQKTNEIMAQLSAIADETSIQLKDLAAAFPEVAPVMQQMGFDAADTAAALAGMYRRGIPATEAAHGLKFALQRLVNPTKDAKEIINDLGFSFFDSSGMASDANVRIAALAVQLENMSDEAKTFNLGELFGQRQAARMQSYFADVYQGQAELKKITADGTVTAEEAAAVQSDWARSLLAAGKVAGFAVKPMDRYNKALEEIKKDPGTALDRIRTQFEILRFQLGQAIAPAIIAIGEKLGKLLEMFMNSPAFVQKFVIGMAAVVTAIGPLRYIFAQARYTIASFMEVFTKFLPRLDEIKGGAKEALDIVKRGGRVVQVGDSYAYAPGSRSFVDKMKQRIGFGPKIAQETREVTQAELERATAAGLSATADDRATTSAILAQAAENELSDELNETTRAATLRAAATDLVATSNQRLAISSLAARAAEKAAGKISGAFAMPEVPIPRTAGRASNALVPLATESMDDIVGGIINLGGASEKSLNKIEKLLNVVKNGTQEEATNALNLIDKLKRKNKITDETISKFINAKNASRGLASSIDDVGASALNAGTVMKALGAGGGGAATATASLTATGASAAAVSGGFASIAATGGIILIVLAAIAAAVIVIVLAIKWMKSNWDVIWPKLEPQVNNLKEAFDILKYSIKIVLTEFSKLFSVFGEVIGQLGTGEDKAKSAAAGFGDTLAKLINGLARFIKIMALVIAYSAKFVQYMRPAIEYVAYIFKNIIGTISELINGDYRKSLLFFAALMWETARPGVKVAELIAKSWLYSMAIMAGATGMAVKTIMTILANSFGKIPILGKLFSNEFKAIAIGADLVKDGLIDFARNLDFTSWIDEKTRTLGGLFSDQYEKAINNNVNQVDPNGAKAADKFKEQVNASFKNWFPDWLSAVKSALDERISKVKTSATKAFEESSKRALEVYDERVKAIDNTEKAEEELAATEEYLSRRREMLANRDIQRLNYRNNRALAIYEGRFNDARMLDIQEIKDKDGFNSDLKNLDDQRSKDLLKKQRDALKNKINQEKEAAEKIWKLNEEAFNDQLDLLMKYTPKTVEEYDSRMKQVNDLLKKYGNETLPKTIENGSQAFVGAFKSAAEQIRESFYWSGNDSAAGWIAGFAPLDVIDILLKDMTDAAEGPLGDFEKDMGNLGGDAGDNFNKNFENAMKELKIESIFNDLKRKFKVGMLIISNIISGTISESWEKVKSWFADSTPIFVSRGLFGQITRIFEIEKQRIGAIWEVARGWFSNPSSIPVYGGMFDNLKIGFYAAFLGIQYLWETIKGWFTNPSSIPIFGGMFDSLKAGFYAAFLTISFLWETIKNWFKTPIPATGELVKNIIKLFLTMAKAILTIVAQIPVVGSIWARAGFEGITNIERFFGLAQGGYVQATPGGIIANIGEGGYDEYVVSTDPKYRAANIGYMAAAAAKMGLSNKSGAATSAASRSYTMPSASARGGEYSAGSQNVYITVDTFVGEEQWFAELAKKYNMVSVPRERKIAGQQRRVISSYNNRWDVK